jgi:hypothetical protein
MEHAIRWIRRAEHLTRPRVTMLVGDRGQRAIGVACFLLSLVLILPIFLGNVAPAATIAVFSLALMQRDGVAALLGWVGTAISVGLLVLAGGVIVAMFRGFFNMVGGWF